MDGFTAVPDRGPLQVEARTPGTAPSHIRGLESQRDPRQGSMSIRVLSGTSIQTSSMSAFEIAMQPSVQSRVA